MKSTKFSFAIILRPEASQFVLKSIRMKQSLLILFLLFATGASAQELPPPAMELVTKIDEAPQVQVRPVINGRVCDSCYMDVDFRHGEVIDFVIIEAIGEFRHEEGQEYITAAKGLENISKYFISNNLFVLDFLPTRVNSKDTHLPLYPHTLELDYRQLEFQVLKNNKVLQDWLPIESLAPEKEYYAAFAERHWMETSDWLSLRAEKYHLAVADKLLVNIRKKGTTAYLQHIYVERVHSVPEPISIKQFPASTSIQDILNKEIVKSGSWILSLDELEIDENNSLLLAFDRDLYQKRLIEYKYADDNVGWSVLDGYACGEPTTAPYYLLIEKLRPGEKKELLLRYRHQPESVQSIKISVKPKPKQLTWIKTAAGISLAVLLFIAGFYFNRRKNKNRLQRLTLKKEELENKLQLLSGQLNPHFLFNSLNSIQNLVNKEEADKATQYLSDVASFLRRVMDAGKKEFISLQEELDIAESYLHLEQKRKPFRYAIERNFGMEISQVDFPPLLLQPVLENCIHHGFGKGHTDPLLTITVSCKDKTVQVSVSDNGKGYDAAATERGQGLSLVEKRIALMNEKLGYQAISSHINSDSSGTITTFTLQNWI